MQSITESSPLKAVRRAASANGNPLPNSAVRAWLRKGRTRQAAATLRRSGVRRNPQPGLESRSEAPHVTRCTSARLSPMSRSCRSLIVANSLNAGAARRRLSSHASSPFAAARTRPAAARIMVAIRNNAAAEWYRVPYVYMDRVSSKTKPNAPDESTVTLAASRRAPSC